MDISIGGFCSSITTGSFDSFEDVFVVLGLSPSACDGVSGWMTLSGWFPPDSNYNIYIGWPFEFVIEYINLGFYLPFSKSVLDLVYPRQNRDVRGILRYLVSFFL